MKIKIFNIFHEKVFDELIEIIPPEQRDIVVMYGVNENIKKQSPGDLLEYNLPIYEPKWQAQGYCQTSCLWHVYKNKLHKDLDYIGFCQYDMKFEKDTIDILLKEMNENTIFYSYMFKGGQAFGGHVNWDLIFEEYSKFHGKDVKKEFLQNVEVPLLHTFVIPAEMFERMMDWVSHYMDNGLVHNYPGPMSQSELSERIFSLFLGVEYATKNLVYKELHMPHMWPMYHNKVPFANYKQKI